MNAEHGISRAATDRAYTEWSNGLAADVADMMGGAREPRPKPQSPVGALALAPCSVSYAVWKHMHDEHGLTLLESEVTEIVRTVNAALDARLRWWINNAEGIAKERGELFRAGEAMRRLLEPDPVPPPEVVAWDNAAQPIREMASSPNVKDEPRPL